MLSRKNRLFLWKLASLFSVVRGYNILVISLAQYLASIYILAPYKSFTAVLFDHKLFLIVFSSALAIASGYLINNFYDAEKDIINRPRKTQLDNYISQKTKLAVYFTLNFLSVILASAVSFRAVLFFSIFIFMLWLYSHKLKKFPFVGNITASVLAVIPFFAVFIYYHNFNPVIFIHATFLFLIISIRELVKDLENIKGDFTQGYQTVPVVFGTLFTKKLITVITFLAAVPTLTLILGDFPIGYMLYYFMLSFFLLMAFLFFLWNSKVKIQYVLLHNLLKFIIVLGAFSIVLIDVTLVLERI